MNYRIYKLKFKMEFILEMEHLMKVQLLFRQMYFFGTLYRGNQAKL